MSFGRRLALFFVLIVLVPMLALIGVLVIVSEDSRQGKADARLSAGLETALAVYQERVADAKPAADDLAAAPELGDGLRSGNSSELRDFAAEAVRDPRVAGVEVLGPAGTTEASAGSDDAIAFAKLELADGGRQRGALRVSVTTADQLATELQRLTKRDVVVEAGGAPLASTVEPPSVDLEPGQTEDVEISGNSFRAHLLDLDDDAGESLLMLAPPTEGNFTAIGRGGLALLVGFLLIAMLLAYALARTLTGLHSRVAEQAITDPLTGLWNRRRMDVLLEREVERAMRFGHTLSVLIVDVDDFKRINDDEGHLVGDKVLEAIAGVVRSTTRSIDVCARYGGDELALMLLETDAKGTEILAERLRENVMHERVAGHDGHRLELTISVGAATLPDCATERDSLIDAADQALLMAKRGGKNRIRTAPGKPRPDANGHGRARTRHRTRAERRRGA